MAGKAAIKQGERRRAAIIKFISKYTDKHGYSPTISEIAAAVNLGSPNATRNHLLRLQDEGLLTMQPKVARSIVLTEKAA